MRGVRAQAIPELLVGLAVTLLVAAATWSVLDLPATYLVAVGALYAATGALILATLPDPLPHRGLGPANRVTLLRTIGTLSLAGLVMHADTLGTTGRWWIVGLGTVIMLLDGVDGWVARRTRTTTGFGALFDMETDAFLMLVLSCLVWTEARAGAWVLLIGAMRYLFVAASFVLPALREELFPSFRRKLVCVIQGIALLVALGPIIPGPVAVAVAALALAMLTWSFGIDTVWLLRPRTS
ncbi:MAG: CDP-alcohol phosphatidyltransferase family protein [Gemmatimonadota bacterium]|nr:CDP-alcohol phosphatidyltransferase family protein [Gemmatimonadota bacterium]